MANYSAALVSRIPRTNRSRRDFPVAIGWHPPSKKPSATHSVKTFAFMFGYLAAYFAAGYGAIAVAERVWVALVP